MPFQKFSFHSSLLTALNSAGYRSCTSFNEAIIPHCLNAESLYISAPIGSGKTTTSLICALHQVIETRENTPSQLNTPSVIILTPTREQAHHIIRTGKEICRYIPNPPVITLCQNPYHSPEKDLSFHMDILVTTPDNLIDSIKEKTISTSGVRSAIYTSADQMLDAGYWHEMDRFHQALPAVHQSILLTSNKQEADLDEVSRLLQKDPFRYTLDTEVKENRFLSQRVHSADSFKHKLALLDFLVRDGEVSTAFVFSNTTSCAKKLSSYLQNNKLPNTLLLDGEKLEADVDIPANEKKYLPNIFIGTNNSIQKLDDIHASHIINFHFPCCPESYFSRKRYLSKEAKYPAIISLVSQTENKKLHLIESLPNNPLVHGVISGLEPKSGQKQNKKGKSGRSFKGKGQHQAHARPVEYSGFMRSNTRRTQCGAEQQTEQNYNTAAASENAKPTLKKEKKAYNKKKRAPRNDNQARTTNYNSYETRQTQSTYNDYYRENNYLEERQEEKPQPTIKVQRKIKTSGEDSGKLKPESKMSRIAGKLGLSAKK